MQLKIVFSAARPLSPVDQLLPKTTEMKYDCVGTCQLVASSCEHHEYLDPGCDQGQGEALSRSLGARRAGLGVCIGDFALTSAVDVSLMEPHGQGLEAQEGPQGLTTKHVMGVSTTTMFPNSCMGITPLKRKGV